MSHGIYAIQSLPNVKLHSPAPATAADPDRAKRKSYQIEKKLGAGGYGEVYKALAPTGSPVAVKIQRNNIHAVQEAENLKDLQNIPAIVRLRETFLGTPEKKTHWTVMSLLPTGDLISTFFNPTTPEIRLVFPEIVSIVTQLAYFFQDMESQGFIYFDLKGDNLIFRRDCRHLTVIDTAGVRNPSRKNDKGPITTPEYSPPEWFLNNNFKQFDRWSLGCVIYSIVTGHPFIPFMLHKDDRALRHTHCLQYIFKRLGTPHPDYLAASSQKDKYIDAEGKFLQPVRLLNKTDWRAEVRLAFVKKSWPHVDTFIHVLERLLCYGPRISPQEILALPLFQKEIPCKLIHDPKIKCFVAITKAAGREAPSDEYDIIIDTKQAVPEQLFLPGDENGEYFVTVVSGETTLAYKALLQPNATLDIREPQQAVQPTSSAVRRSLFAEINAAASPALDNSILVPDSSKELPTLFPELDAVIDPSSPASPKKARKDDSDETPPAPAPAKPVLRPRRVKFTKKNP